MLDVGYELLTLVAGTEYTPTFVSTDKRNPNSTSIGYNQIGVTQQYGFAKGPIFKVDFVDLSSVTATHIKIWGIGNEDDDAPIYPKTYFTGGNGVKSTVNVYLKKFIFCNSSGTQQAAGGSYVIVGHKRRAYPIVW